MGKECGAILFESMLRLQGQQQLRQKRRYLVGLLDEAIPIVFELLYGHRFSSASPLVNFCHPAGPDLHDKSLSAPIITLDGTFLGSSQKLRKMTALIKFSSKQDLPPETPAHETMWM